MFIVSPFLFESYNSFVIKTGTLYVTAALINKDVLYDRSNSLQLRQSALQNKCNFCCRGGLSYKMELLYIISYKERHFLNGRLWDTFYGYIKITVQGTYPWRERNCIMFCAINPLKPELNPIWYLLALLAHHFLHVSRIRVKSLTFRRLMSYIYIYIWSTHSWCF